MRRFKQRGKVAFAPVPLGRVRIRQHPPSPSAQNIRAGHSRKCCVQGRDDWFLSAEGVAQDLSCVLPHTKALGALGDSDHLDIALRMLN